ncbi:MAG TPA: sulfotransferase domain-containing protein [Rhizomicrobium sp.]|nr:sulfotransferase domain-containing protein [Rhizomicrobium sp.]
MARNLILIAGYPKSGSTWVRVVLETLRRGPGWRVSINDMAHAWYGAPKRQLFDELAPVNSAELLPDEIDDVLPQVFRALSERAGAPHIVKSHDGAVRTRSGEWLYPQDCVRAVIYLTRHPFDVAVSYAHHMGLSTREAVQHMGDDETVALSTDRLRRQLHERLGSWSGNVSSWLDATGYDVIAARYEDMFASPADGFARLVQRAGFAASDADIARACEAASFDRLRSEEQRAGFVERPRMSPQFYRAGKPLSWVGALDDETRAKLVDDHGAVMTRLGYDTEGRASAAPDWRAFA